jgi:hypothetical protein
MNKRMLGILMASSILVTLPVGLASAQNTAAPAAYQLAMNVEDLTDVPTNHWAYNAVKVLVEELDIMSPKSANQFKGNDLLTRYELAQIFHNAVKKLESISGKDLRKLGDANDAEMTDVDAAQAKTVNSIVNEYGIMQPMPGKRFMGDEPISRYEIAFEMYNYFTLLESKGTSPSLARRDRVSQIQDLPADHWATKAVNEIVDKYQIMDGYPDASFRGGKRLTRYEAAATIREFIRYVDTYLIPLTPAPTPVPTAVPTAKPTPAPTPTPVPVATKVPVKKLDIRLGGDFKVSNVATATNPNDIGFIYGPNASLDWTPLSANEYNHFGIDLHGDLMMYEGGGKFKASQMLANGTKQTTDLNSRLTAGGGLLWKLQGSAQEVGLLVGVGYDYLQLFGVNYSYANHGPRGRIDLEIPIGSWFSIVARDAFTYFIGQTANINDNIQWKNDAFLGITIPAYSTFSVELGYKDTRYMNAGSNTIFGDIGGELNLRFRF